MENKETPEKLDDDILREVRGICLGFVETPATIVNYEHDQLMVSYEFVMKKINEISKLKKDLKIPKYYLPFQEIGRHLDNLTMHDLHGSSESLIINSMTKEVNYLLENLMFCFYILEKMIYLKETDVCKNQYTQ